MVLWLPPRIWLMRFWLMGSAAMASTKNTESGVGPLPCRAAMIVNGLRGGMIGGTGGGDVGQYAQECVGWISTGRSLGAGLFGQVRDLPAQAIPAFSHAKVAT